MSVILILKLTRLPIVFYSVCYFYLVLFSSFQFVLITFFLSRRFFAKTTITRTKNTKNLQLIPNIVVSRYFLDKEPITSPPVPCKWFLKSDNDPEIDHSIAERQCALEQLFDWPIIAALLTISLSKTLGKRDIRWAIWRISSTTQPQARQVTRGIISDVRAR